MKDEIKEKMTIGKAKKILRGFLAKDCYYDTPLYYAIPYLLDYITNLQEEKDYYFKKNNELSTLNTSLRNDRDIYKTRIDKAIEYINYYGTTPEQNDDTTCRIILKSLLNILQGSDE